MTATENTCSASRTGYFFSFLPTLSFQLLCLFLTLLNLLVFLQFQALGKINSCEKITTNEYLIKIRKSGTEELIASTSKKGGRGEKIKIVFLFYHFQFPLTS